MILDRGASSSHVSLMIKINRIVTAVLFPTLYFPYYKQQDVPTVEVPFALSIKLVFYSRTPWYTPTANNNLLTTFRWGQTVVIFLKFIMASFITNVSGYFINHGTRFNYPLRVCIVVALHVLKRCNTSTVQPVWRVATSYKRNPAINFSYR